jgi:nucleotide-binding universal stress UspA family protein
MKTILVPTDGSTTADAALDVALDLAEKHGAGLKLLHVLLRDKEPFELLRLPGLGAAGGDLKGALDQLAKAPKASRSPGDILAHPNAPEHPAPDDLLRRIGAQVLKRAGQRAIRRGIAAEPLAIADGPAAAAIVAAARAHNIDTIVLGMRGLREIEAVTLGSVSQEVCRAAPCACIAVHPPRDAEA